MMYKLLPFVAAVAAEEFMGRRLTTPTAPPAGGEGFKAASDGVKATGHGYKAGDKLHLDPIPSTCTGGKVQGGLTANTTYTVKAAADAVKANEFKLTTSAGADVDITEATAHSECVTWSQLIGNKVNCGAVGTDAADPKACAEKVAATTGDNAKAKHWKFTLTDGHTLDKKRVRYSCGLSAGTGGTAVCLDGMTDGSYFTVAKDGASTTKVTLKAAGATADFDGGDTLTDNKNKIAKAAGAEAHAFQQAGDAWKSITTTAKPAAGSSNFHVMVATVFSAFFYLMM